VTTQWRAVPTYGTPLTIKDAIVSAWYRWWQDIETGKPPSDVEIVAVGASPFSYVAARRGFVILVGGTVSAISFIRTAPTATGLTAGIFPLAAGDTLKVTHTGAPAMTFVPT